jgi:hypothetical protein
MNIGFKERADKIGSHKKMHTQGEESEMEQTEMYNELEKES